MRTLVAALALLAPLAAPLAAQAPALGAPDALPPATPPSLGSAATWTLDETTTGDDVHWVSPSAVDPAAFAYDAQITIELVEVTATVIIPITVDVTGDIDPALLVTEANFAGPAPLELLGFPVVVPEPPEPPAVQGDASFGLDAAGFGFFDFTDVTLGSATVPTPFGDVTAPIDSLRLVASITVAPTSWLVLGSALAGSGGLAPTLSGSGELVGGGAVALTLADALPGAPSFVVLGASEANLAFKQGVLVPSPDLIRNGPPVGAGGGWTLPATWPAGVPAGVVLYFQVWVADPGAPAGFAASNALAAITG